ncbi:MAG: SGNH/GDSL hydrolase family protein [Pseudomonadota bacterium]
MSLSLTLGLAINAGGWQASGEGSSPTSQAVQVLGSRQGFAIDFVNKRMVVNDATTPANAFDGDPEVKLTREGTAAYDYDPVKGLNLAASRDFGVRLSTGLFPFNPNAIHVFARYELNSGDSAEQRYLLMVDNSGNDRFAMYTTSGVPFRLVTGDGAAADTEITGLTLEPGVEYKTFFGADQHGRHWADSSGVVTHDTLHQLSMSTPAEIGIGMYNHIALRQLDGYLAEIAVICEPMAHEGLITNDPPAVTFAAEGDSHTFNTSTNPGYPQGDLDLFYPKLVADGMNANWGWRNRGVSGESSAEMVTSAAMADFLANGVPEIAAIYAGSNDVKDLTIASAPVSTATVLHVNPDAVAQGKLAVEGKVKINGQSRKIAALNGTEITLETPLSGAPAVGDELTVDTVENLKTWIGHMHAAGVPRVIVIGAHYLNFAASGDTPTAEQSLRSRIRVDQQAAATAMGVEYIDTYAHMRDVIVTGAVAQGDWAVWHPAPTDTHLTPAGEQALADAIVAYLQANP